MFDGFLGFAVVFVIGCACGHFAPIVYARVYWKLWDLVDYLKSIINFK